VEVSRWSSKPSRCAAWGARDGPSLRVGCSIARTADGRGVACSRGDARRRRLPQLGRAVRSGYECMGGGGADGDGAGCSRHGGARGQVARCCVLAGKTMRRRRTEISASSDAVGPLLLPRAMFCAAVESAASARDDATAATSTPVKRGSARGRLTPATRHAYGRSPTCWLRPLPALVSPRHAVRRRRVALRCERGTAEESSCRDRRHWGRAPSFSCVGGRRRRVAANCLPSPPAAIRPRARSTTPHTPSHIPEP